MSDRLAVFNKGRIEQIGAPAEVYERPATRFVAGLRRDVQPADRDGRGGDRSVEPGRSPSGPRRSGSPIRRRDGRGRRDDGARAHPGRRLSRPGHALHRRARRRRPSSSSPSRISRRPRPRRSRCRARLSGWCGRDSTICPSPTASDRRVGGGENDEDTTVAGAGRGGRDRRLGVFERRCVHGAERSRDVGARPGRAASRRRLGGAQRGGSRRRARACRRPPSSGAHRARRSTSWPGRATSRTGRPTRPSTGSPTSRRRAGAPSSPRSSGPRMRRTRSSRRTPSSSTSSRRPVTPACDSSAAGSSSRSTWTCSRAIRTSSMRSRTSRTTRSTASVRRPARARLEPADVADRPGDAGPDERGRRCSTRPTATRSASTTRPIYIADAAVVLMATKPELGSRTRTRSTTPSSRPPIDLLKQQKPAVTQRWVDYLKQMDDFRSGTSNVGHDLADHHQPAQGREAAGRGRRHQAAGGRDRLVRHLDDQLEDQEPRLRVRVHRLPDVARDQRQDRRVVRRGAGQLEVVRADRRQEPLHDLPRRRRRILEGRLVLADADRGHCVDGRTDVKCKGFDDWIKAWTEIKG